MNKTASQIVDHLLEKFAANRMMREMQAADPVNADRLRAMRAATNRGNQMMKDPSLSAVGGLHPEHAAKVRQGAGIYNSPPKVRKVQGDTLDWMNKMRNSGSPNVHKSNINEAMKRMDIAAKPGAWNSFKRFAGKHPVGMGVGAGLLAAGTGAGLLLGKRQATPEQQYAV